jgi:hypothetical protein
MYLLAEIIHLAWERFKVITAIIGDIQGRFIATLFYFTILLPFGIGSRMFSDPLRQRLATEKTQWLERSPVSEKIDAALKQG